MTKIRDIPKNAKSAVKKTGIFCLRATMNSELAYNCGIAVAREQEATINSTENRAKFFLCRYYL